MTITMLHAGSDRGIENAGGNERGSDGFGTFRPKGKVSPFTRPTTVAITDNDFHGEKKPMF